MLPGYIDSATQVDVVVVAFDDLPALEICIKSIHASVGVNAKTIVVDNSNNPATKDLVHRLGGRFVRSGRNIGYGAACNVGLGLATANWVAFSNQDISVGAETIVRLVEAAEGHENRTGRQAVVGPLLTLDGRIVADGGHRLPSVGTQIVELLAGERAAGSRRSIALHDAPVQCGWIPGAFLVGGAAAFRSIDGFDASYFMYVEDVDLFARLAERNVDCLLVPSATVIHSGGRRPINYRLYGRTLRNWSHFFRLRNGNAAGAAIFCAGIAGSFFRWAMWGVRLMRSPSDENRAYARMFGRGALAAIWAIPYEEPREHRRRLPLRRAVERQIQ